MRRLSSMLLASLALLSLLSGCSSNTRSEDRARFNNGSGLEHQRVVQRIERASDVYRLLLTGPDADIPEKLLANAECVAVLPDVLKAAFIAGGRYGKGIVSCRLDSGQWSAPAFITLSGGSVGWQIGAESTDLVLFFTGPDSRKAVMKSSNITLGADLSIAAGPVGRKAEGKTDFSRTGIYSYAAASGLFAGISLEGAMISADPESNETLYGESFGSAVIISGDAVPTPPAQVTRFLSLLPTKS